MCANTDPNATAPSLRTRATHSICAERAERRLAHGLDATGNCREGYTAAGRNWCGWTRRRASCRQLQKKTEFRHLPDDTKGAPAATDEPTTRMVVGRSVGRRHRLLVRRTPLGRRKFRRSRDRGPAHRWHAADVMMLCGHRGCRRSPVFRCVAVGITPRRRMI